jgi:uncharacterized protein (TIGR00375 family)
MIINADLHIHSPFTKRGAIENNFSLLSINAKKKGLDFLATGDCLQPEWLKLITQLDPIDEGTFQNQEVLFILSTEVQTQDKIHHLIYFPDLTSLYDFKDQLKGLDIDFKQGRPDIPISSEKLANIALDVSSIIGPSHIFDAFSGVYTRYNSLLNCYGSATSHIFFAELGLGLNTYYADLIKELHEITFLTNSDTHNPHPIRLGREFTRFKVKKPLTKYLIEAIKRKNQNKPVLNVGFPPEEGKYYQTSCTNCHKNYTYEQAQKRKWKCTCQGYIKKGIKEKIIQKSDINQYHYPYHRPLYLSFLPLYEIITQTLNQKNPFVESVEQYYEKLISIFGNELHLMLETPIKNIEQVADYSVAHIIREFRMATFKYNTGGGGNYGKLQIKNQQKKLNDNRVEKEKRININ